MDRALLHGLNRVTLVGYLGRAPEMRYTPSGKPVTSFSIVTTHTWISSNREIQEETDWFNVVAGPLADSGLAEPDRWLMFGGVPSRNSVTPNSAPLLNLRWHVAAHESLTTERLLRERRQYYVENQDQGILPGLDMPFGKTPGAVGCVSEK